MGVNGLYGLSGSGLDIESMVKAGMLSRQNQYDKMYKKEVKNEWLKQGFNEIYTSLNTFKYTTLSDYKMQSNMSAMGAESSDKSTVTATANGSAVAMTHNVEVVSLSQNAYLLSDEAITRNTSDEKRQSSIYLKDIAFEKIEKNADGTFNVKFANGGGTLENVSADATAISFLVQDDAKDPNTISEDDKKKQTVSYSFNDIFESKTLNDLAADIKNLNTNVTASYDATNDSFSLYNKESGSAATVKLTMAGAGDVEGGKGAAALFNALHLGKSHDGQLDRGATDFAAGATKTTTGSDGTVKIIRTSRTIA